MPDMYDFYPEKWGEPDPEYPGEKASIPDAEQPAGSALTPDTWSWASDLRLWVVYQNVRAAARRGNL